MAHPASWLEGAGVNPAFGGITPRIAASVRNAIWPSDHVFLDLHSSGDVARSSMCARYHPVENPNLAEKFEQTARWFGVPYLMVDRECFTVAPFDGHFKRLLECGTSIQRGGYGGLSARIRSY